MREDMAKVVTERPRRGHGNASNKITGQRIRSHDPNREYDKRNRLPIAPGLLVLYRVRGVGLERRDLRSLEAVE